MSARIGCTRRMVNPRSTMVEAIRRLVELGLKAKAKL